MKFNIHDFTWTREPAAFTVSDNKVEIVTSLDYSDWATTAIDASIKSMWYRFSRRADDYCIECSTDGENFSQMRVCHMHKGGGKICFGIYACSPEDASFKAVFTNMELTDCKWLAHDGQ